MDQSRASNVENVSYTPSTLRPATANVLGGIKIGAGLNVTADGTTSVKIATALAPGMVKIGTGLAIAADGTLSATASAVVTSPSVGTTTVSNSSLVYTSFVVSYGGNFPPNVARPDLNDWRNMGMLARIPANGTYRFRVIGQFYWQEDTGKPSESIAHPGMIRIYVNGVNSSAADITFTQVTKYPPITAQDDVYRDIAGLVKGDKIEIYYKWADRASDGQLSHRGHADFRILIASDNVFGIYALSDYGINIFPKGSPTIPASVDPFSTSGNTSDAY
jgi:hypothetical protein